MNNLLTWLSAQAELNTYIVHPVNTSSLGGQFKRLLTGKRWAGRPLNKFYDKGGFNPGHEMVDFYASFHNYLSTTALWEMPFRAVGALLGLILWYGANAVQWFYVMSYRLLNLHLVEQMARAGGNTGHLTISQLFVYANQFGLAVFGIVLLCYVIGTIINSPTYERYKNIFRNVVLILFMLVALPNLTTAFSDGVNDIAGGMFQGETTSHPENNPNNLANLAYEDNVVSVPMRMQNTKMGDNMATDHVYRFHGRAPIQGVKVNPVYIDLYRMKPSERNEWNGFNKQTVPSFLVSYINPQEAINDDSLKDYADSAKGKKRNIIARGIHDLDSGADDVSTVLQDLPGGGILHYLTGHGTKLTGSWASQSFDNTFEYHVDSYGLKSGNSLDSYSLQKFPQFSFLGNVSSGAGSTITTKPFYRSYGYYSVNWLGVYEQLIMVILIVGAYLFKTFELIFKNVIMYVSSGLLLLRNADNYQRIKYFLRSLFSIYEMAIMDIIMCYTSMYILYPAYHQFNSWLLVKTNSAYIANRWTVTLINLIGDIALFTIATHGTTTVDAMVGPAGGGAKSGASGYFGSMLALRGGSMLARGAGHIKNGAVATAKAPFKATRDLLGAKGAGNAFASRNAGKGKGAFSALKDAHKGKEQAKQDQAESVQGGRKHGATGFGNMSPNKPGNATAGHGSHGALHNSDTASAHNDSSSANGRTNNATNNQQTKQGLNRNGKNGNGNSQNGSNRNGSAKTGSANNGNSPVTQGDTAVSGSDDPSGAFDGNAGQQGSDTNNSSDDTNETGADDDADDANTDDSPDESPADDVADNATTEDNQDSSASGALNSGQPKSLGNGRYDFGGTKSNSTNAGSSIAHNDNNTEHTTNGALNQDSANQHSDIAHSNRTGVNGGHVTNGGTTTTNNGTNGSANGGNVTGNGGANHNNHDGHGTGALNGSTVTPNNPSGNNGGGSANGGATVGGTGTTGTAPSGDDGNAIGGTVDNGSSDNGGSTPGDDAGVADGDTDVGDTGATTGALNDNGINGSTDTTDDTTTDNADTDAGDGGSPVDDTGTGNSTPNYTSFTGRDYGFGNNGQPLVHGANGGTHNIDQDVDKTDTTTNTNDVTDDGSQPSFSGSQPDVTTNNGAGSAPHYDFTNRNWGMNPNNKTVVHKHIHRHHIIHNITRHHHKGKGGFHFNFHFNPNDLTKK